MSINYQEILQNYPWILERNQKIILSPDSDGILCGILFTNFLDAEVVGYYDGKVLAVKNGINPEECTFLDIEIFKEGVKSCGHHMVLYNKTILMRNPELLNHFSDCIQPNIFRGFDAKNNFQSKYPFATIHFLLGLLQEGEIISRNQLAETSVWPLLFTDGTWINLFGYTENCLDWLSYLNIDNENHILHDIFYSERSVISIMHNINSLLRERDSRNAVGFFNGDTYVERGRNKRTGDKFKLSSSNGQAINLVPSSTLEGVYDVHELEKNRMIDFYTYISDQMGWTFIEEKWNFENLDVHVFRKSNTKADGYSSLNNGNYSMIMENPLLLSLAITSGTGVEYTIDEEGVIKNSITENEYLY